MLNSFESIKNNREIFFVDVIDQVTFCKILGFLSLVILLSAGTAAQTEDSGQDLGLLAYEDRGQVKNTLIVSAEDETTVYKDAKIVSLPLEQNIREEWEDVELTPLTPQVGSFFFFQSHSEGLLYPPLFQVDVSDKEPGNYALFLWGCERNGDPSTCTWLKPHKFQKTGPPVDSSGSSSSSADSSSDGSPAVSIESPDFVREGDTASFEALTANIPGEVQSYNWEITRNGETVLEDTGKTVSHNIERQLDYYPLKVHLEVVTDQNTYESEIEQWVALSKPEGMDIMVSPHRGGYHGPENTVMTFEQARKSGADSVEFDVKHTADGNYVVRHDRSTVRTTVEDIIVPESPLDKLLEINVVKEHPVMNKYDLEIDKETASQETVPSLNETLDYFQSTDMTMRMELKGEIKASETYGQEIYKRVADRGLEDQVIFMSSRGECLTGAIVTSSSGLVCSWNALEGINAVSDGEATTAILWYKRNKPWEVDYNDIKDSATSDPIGVGTSAATQGVVVPLGKTLKYADEQGIDIVVPRDSYRYPESSLEHSMMYRSEFVEEARDRNLDYAFMGFRHTSDEYTKREQMARCGVEWLSTNRPEGAMETVSDWGPESYQYDPTACEVPDDERVDGVDVLATIGGEGQDYLEYLGDTVNAPFEAGMEGAVGVQQWTGNMIDDPSLETVGDGIQGTGEYAYDLADGTFDHASKGASGAWEGTKNIVGTSYDGATNIVRDPKGFTEDTASSAVEESKDAYCNNIGIGCG